MLLKANNFVWQAKIFLFVSTPVKNVLIFIAITNSKSLLHLSKCKVCSSDGLLLPHVKKKKKHSV